ncbi:MAG: tripartite tricarboxylate transporter substrate binding protein [Rubrivivax sp.]|nr:tripartite tricarboxylate transporter substrate binding protein [Rubrivivax sp.]
MTASRCPSGSFRPTRRQAVTVLSAQLAGAALPLRAETRFPSRPITLFVPWPAGGATDLTLRVLAEIAGKTLGQEVLIENRGGAAGTLAMPVLQQAAPDGYTIAQIPQPVLRVPHTRKVLWDPIRDTTPIIQISGVTFGLLVRAASPFRSLQDLFDYARAHPGELSIATNGTGSTPHVVLEELFTSRGLRYIHVPYKGTAEQLLAVESGQVMAGVNSNGFAPAVDDGRLRMLAIFSAERSSRWPTVPTLTELGFPIVAMSPYGLAGPRGLPPAVVATLHDAFHKAMLDPRFVQEIAKYDQSLAYRGPADYARWMREEFERERAAAQRLGTLRDGG